MIHRRLGKGTVTYIGTDTDDGKLEKEVVRRVYTVSYTHLDVYKRQHE